MPTLKTIFFLLPNGITVRNFMSTGVIEQLILKDNIRIVVFTSFPQAFDKYKNQSEKIVIKKFITRQLFTLANLLHIILRRRFYKVNETISTRILSKGPLFPVRHNSILEFLLSQPLSRSKKIYKMLRLLSSRLNGHSTQILKIFKDYKPSLVISTHPIAMDEVEFLSCAKKLEIKTIGMIKSWDNITTKGYIPIKSDCYLVWNSVIKNEMIQIHGISKKNIFVTGVPQFDPYADKKTIVERNSFFNKLCLNSNYKTVFFATSPASIGPEDPDIIDKLIRNFNKNKINNIQIIARLHPLDSMERYEELKNKNFKNLAFQIPGESQNDKRVKGILDPMFIAELRDTMFHSDVTINTCSTTSLDAIAIDKPVINIAFDLKPREYYQSCKRYYDFDHFKPILNSGATKLAFNFDEFINLIHRYMKNSKLENYERTKLKDLMCYKVDGMSSKRIVAKIVENLNL